MHEHHLYQDVEFNMKPLHVHYKMEIACHESERLQCGDGRAMVITF